MLTEDNAQLVGGFYSEREFDLGPLLKSGRKVLELGRSCVHPDHRTGGAMAVMWSALAEYVQERQIDVLFGVASFYGTDQSKLAGPLSLLHARHLAPAALRVTARSDHGVAMNTLAETAIDRRAAMVAMPALIKAYLRLGGVVGQGAWVDHGFNTTDVCMLLDTHAMTDSQARWKRARS